MTIVVSNAVLGVDNRITINSTSNSFAFTVGSSTHEANTSSLKINTTVVNNSGVYVSGSSLRGEAGDVVFANPSAPAPNGFLAANTSYLITEKQNFFNIYGHATTSWDVRSSGTTDVLREVAYGNGVYVAVGENGAVSTSTDATTWTLGTALSATQTDVTYDGVNGIFVSVGAQGSIFTSTDGVTWTARTGASGTATLWGVAYGNGVYVSVGTGGISQQYIQSSTDAITWTTRFTGSTSSGAFLGVTYGNGVFVTTGSSGSVRTSTDGTTWTSRTSANASPALYDIVYTNGVFVAVGGDTGSALGSIQTSTDGITWTNRTPAATSGSNTYLTSITHGNGQFVVTGLAENFGGTVRSGTGNVQTSTDGITWTRRDQALNSYLWGAGYGNGIYLIAGESGSIQTIDVNYATQFRAPNITAPNNTIAYVREK